MASFSERDPLQSRSSTTLYSHCIRAVRTNPTVTSSPRAPPFTHWTLAQQQPGLFRNHGGAAPALPALFHELSSTGGAARGAPLQAREGRHGPRQMEHAAGVHGPARG